MEKKGAGNLYKQSTVLVVVDIGSDSKSMACLLHHLRTEISLLGHRHPTLGLLEQWSCVTDSCYTINGGLHRTNHIPF